MATLHLCSDADWQKIKESCAFLCDEYIAALEVTDDARAPSPTTTLEEKLLGRLLLLDPAAMRAKKSVERIAKFITDKKVHVRSMTLHDHLFVKLMFQAKRIQAEECQRKCCNFRYEEEVREPDVIWPAEKKCGSTFSL